MDKFQIFQKFFFSNTTSIVVFVAILAVPFLLLFGGIALADKILPILDVISTGLAFIIVFILLPASLFEKTRIFSGVFLVSLSYFYVAFLFLYSILIIFALWGGWGFLAIFFLQAVSIVAVILTLITEEWHFLTGILSLILLRYGTRVLGLYVLSKAKKYRGYFYSKKQSSSSAEDIVEAEIVEESKLRSPAE